MPLGTIAAWWAVICLCPIAGALLVIRTSPYVSLLAVALLGDLILAPAMARWGATGRHKSAPDHRK